MSRKNKAKQQQLRTPAAGPTPTGSKLRVILKVFFTTVLTLAAAEWLCRSMFKKNIEELKFTQSDLYYYYDRAGYRHNMPNTVGYERMWNDQGKAEFRINSFGFRGPEITAQKPAGTTRLFFLGDSITLGGRLPEDVPFASQVGKALSADRSTRYEIINAGVGDVGLYEEKDTLLSEGLKLHPDVVVLCWYLNDARPPIGFPEEVVYNNWLISWFNNHPIFEKSYLAGFVYDTVRKSLVTRHLFQDHRFDWIEPYKTAKWATDANAFANVVHLAQYDWGDAWNEKSMKWMEERIRDLRDITEAKGIKFVVIALPVHAQVYAQFKSPIIDQPQDHLVAFAKQNGIKILNLLPLLRPVGAKEKIFYDQCHYTPRGNEVVAHLILDFLRKTGALRQ